MLDRLKINTLVDQVVTMARNDETVPKPENLREGWETDVLLRHIDASVVGECDDPAAYAEIGRRMLEEVRDLPEMAVLAMLAILRGERLLPLTSGRKQLIYQLAKDLKAAISVLRDGTRKQRCLELYLYHLGVFYDALGRFNLAIRMHEWAVREAGESSSATISLFLSAVYRLKEALLVGETPDELFLDLEEKFAQLVKALRGSELQTQWAEGNCPIHMIQMCVWLDRSHPKWNNWVATALAAAEKLGKAWKSGAEFVRAADMYKHDDPQAIEALKAMAASSGNTNERRATALLLLARRALRDGEVGEARSLIDQMPEQGAQHVRAIAERMML